MSGGASAREAFGRSDLREGMTTCFGCEDDVLYVAESEEESGSQGCTVAIGVSDSGTG